MQNFIYNVLLIIAMCSSLGAQTPGKETVLLETPYGNMKIKLYKETPLHRKNFLKLVRSHFYDSLLFHRVINNFMIQGGDPLSKHAKTGDSLGHGDIGYVVPAEFDPKLIHQKGRLCAARENDDINPEQASSGSQFYIVMGKKRTLEDLKKYEDRINKKYLENCERKFSKSLDGMALKKTHDRLAVTGKADSAGLVSRKIDSLVQVLYHKKPEYKFSQQQIDVYTTIGGTPHLDGTYTVFGEVIEGMDVIDKIAAVQTDKRDRPVSDIRMKMRVIK
jgi:cyclophilin family peptidyl-prolyl cis-trans isomerase